jgi:autotransporter-associated beta strand protein
MWYALSVGLRRSRGVRFALFAGIFIACTFAARGQDPRITAESGGTNLQSPLANSSWTGGTSTQWSNAANWTLGVPGNNDTAFFDANFTSSNQPTLTANQQVGLVNMTSTVTQNVTISGGFQLQINAPAGSGIQLDNSAFTLTISTDTLRVQNDQTWTNNSTLAGNSLTVSSPTVNLNGKALTVTGVGNTLISGVMTSGGGSFVQNGTGTTTLSGANTYDGPTTVNAGTLLITGNSTGANGLTTVNSGGTLGGNGTIGGAVTVAAGGSLAPGLGGNTTAVLTEEGALTLSAGSNFNIDINGTAVGTGYDQLVSQNTVTLTGSNLTVHVGTTLSGGETFTILNKTSAGAITGTFLQGTQVVADNGYIFTVTYTGGNGNDVVLTFTGQVAIPEPGTWFAGALVVAALGFTQRRRFARALSRSRLLVRRLPSAT